MPVLFVLLLLLLVNFSPLVFADTVPTQIRGPKNTDNQLLLKQYGPLTANDTLWRIAEQVKPSSSVSTYQVMYAIFVKNPHAFIDANFNHMQPGAVLLLPDLRDIRSIDPEVARRKAETDEQAWAQKVAREAAARARAREQSTKPNLVQQQTAAELTALKDQYQDSMQLIEGIARENENLRGSLGRVEQELEGLKAQLAEDSLLQQQLNQLLQQQQQILLQQQAQQEAEAAAQAAAAESSTFSDLLANPLSWVLAAFVPALLLLFGGVLWIKRRGRKTEEAVAAAVKEPVAAAGYQSPLPPLDNSQDFDDSLFDLDDSLLGDAFDEQKSPAVTTSNDPLLDDELPDFSDDIILDDFGEEDPLKTDMLDTELSEDLDINLDDELTTDSAGETDIALESKSDEVFDANNILSDTDLSALLMMADDDDDDVIELADPEDNALSDNLVEEGTINQDLADESEIDDLLAQANTELSDQDDIDNLLAQSSGSNISDQDDIDNLLAQSSGSNISDQDDIDNLIEEIELDLPEESVEDDAIDDLLRQNTSEETLDDMPADAEQSMLDDDMYAEAREADTLDTLLMETEASAEGEVSKFDNSELEAFAEQLAAEVDEIEDNDIPALSEDEMLLSNEMDDILQQAIEQQGSEQFQQEADESLPAELASTPNAEPEINPESVTPSDLESIFTSEDTPAIPDIEIADQEDAAQTQEFELDLASSEDQSVVVQSDAALAVENPSKVLDSYPELEMSESELNEHMLSEDEFELSAAEIEQLTSDEEVEAELVTEEADVDEAAVPAPAEDEENAVALATQETGSDELAEQVLEAADEENAVALATQETDSDELAEQVLEAVDVENVVEPATDEIDVAEGAASLQEEADLNALDFEEDTSTNLLAEIEDDATTENDVLADLELQEFDNLLGELEILDHQEEDFDEYTTEQSEPASEPQLDDALSDDDFLEIDNLLAAMEQTAEDPERFSHLNVDVGLDDFADVIGDHRKTDVDQEDAGFAGKLDLIRAYKEMDEPETAAILIDELLNSDAPEHLKAEAKTLRPE